jgi:ComF family protein
MPGNCKYRYLQHNKYNMNVIEHIIAALAPHECLACQKEGLLICCDCQKHLASVASTCYRCGCFADQYRTCQRCRRTSPLFLVMRATAYEGVAKELVHGLKFGRQKDGSRVIAEVLASRLGEFAGTDTAITNVPTASSRVRRRGYDHAAGIARHLARLLALPYVPLLARDGQARQVGQSRQSRRRQLEGVFRSTMPAPRRILLVDDVITTGASLETAARVLRAAGATHVFGAVFAVAE